MDLGLDIAVHARNKSSLRHTVILSAKGTELVGRLARQAAELK
jgi:hypothetical protein